MNMEIEKVLEKLSQQRYYARANFIPIIRDKSAVFLYNFVRDNGYKNILEIGTAIGYSGNIILSAGANHLTTIDINETYLQMAKNNFEIFGNLDKVTIINNDAKVVLKDLVEKNQKFDMIFLDGAKGQYVSYLPDLKNLLEKNGAIFADNVLLGGMVESEDIIPHKKRTMVVNLRKYLKAVNAYPFETELIRLEDGIAITKVKGE
ncbi:MAG: O-methyltransferase [Firmicutes bacterium]|nr:O-methyltransferase [Bacillota bacterium]